MLDAQSSSDFKPLPVEAGGPLQVYLVYTAAKGFEIEVPRLLLSRMGLMASGSVVVQIDITPMRRRLLISNSPKGAFEMKFYGRTGKVGCAGVKEILSPVRQKTPVRSELFNGQLIIWLPTEAEDAATADKVRQLEEAKKAEARRAAIAEKRALRAAAREAEKREEGLTDYRRSAPNTDQAKRGFWARISEQLGFIKGD